MNHAAKNTPDTSGRVRKVELLISNILRLGVITSLCIIVAGTLLSFVHHPSYVWAPAELQRLTAPGAAFPHTVAEVLTGVADLRGQAFVSIGLLILVATPVARVAVSIIAFAYQREPIFVVITTTVLLLLLLSFALGRIEG